MKSNHPFYRLARWRKLRQLVRTDAGHRCSVCGREAEGRDGNVHHVYPVADHIPVRFEPLNLRYVCVACHRNEERNPNRGCDADGFPRDPAHAAYACRNH
jgi:HNH endonuclease